MDEVTPGYLGHGHLISPPILTHAWKGNSAPSYDCSHQGFLASCGGEEVGGYSCGLRVSDVFPEELLGISPKRAIEFKIEMQPGTAPIAKSPYKTSPLELVELKIQLQNLLDKGFIHPSSSPWGCPTLFISNTTGKRHVFLGFFMFLGADVHNQKYVPRLKN
jgi:hypothetical protein